MKKFPISEKEKGDFFLRPQSHQKNRIFENIYGTSGKSFYNIDLGTNVILKGKNCEIYNKEMNESNIPH